MRGWWGRFLQQRVQEIQKSTDADLRTLPASSRYVLAPALSALASFYAAASATRNFLYRHGLLWPTPLPSPVISIGQLTNGGTGKTPFVEYMARCYLKSHRFPSLILQRGHGTVDETVMLRHLFEGLPVVVSESTERASVAKEYLLANPNVRLVLLDDGLQHLPLVRDLEIVMVNALQPLGNGHLIPRGTLRELPKAALRRADAVVMHHADLAGPEHMEALQRMLSSLAPRHTLFMQTAMAPISLRSLIAHPGVDMAGSLDQSVSVGMGEHVQLSALHGAAVVCMVAIGHPQTVEEHLRRLGVVHIEGCGAWDDHHMFSLEEIEAAIERVRQLQAQSQKYRHACIVMTEKDYARQHNLFDAVFSRYTSESSRAAYWNGGSSSSSEGRSGGAEAGAGEGAGEQLGAGGCVSAEADVGAGTSSGTAGALEQQAGPSSSRGGSSSSGGGGGSIVGPAARADFDDMACAEGGTGPQCGGTPAWGAYVLQSSLQVVQHDRRFSSQNAVLNAMLRMAVDNYRRRSYVTS